MGAGFLMRAATDASSGCTLAGAAAVAASRKRSARSSSPPCGHDNMKQDLEPPAVGSLFAGGRRGGSTFRGHSAQSSPPSCERQGFGSIQPGLE